MEKCPIEPFAAFHAFLIRYAGDEGFLDDAFIPASHLAIVRQAAREFGVIYHDDGTLELIKQ